MGSGTIHKYSTLNWAVFKPPDFFSVLAPTTWDTLRAQFSGTWVTLLNENVT